MPSASTTRQCHGEKRSRSSRAGTSLRKTEPMGRTAPLDIRRSVRRRAAPGNGAGRGGPRERARRFPPQARRPFYVSFMTRSALLLCLSLSSLAACAGPSKSLPVREAPIEYQVGPYTQTASLHAPLTRVGRRPAVILLHSGFFGVQRPDRDLAQELAVRGVVVAVPAYRGQKRLLDGERAEGGVEFCGGEVRDGAVLLERLRDRPDVRRVGLIGFSHGACVALRMAAEEQGVSALVSFSAPTDAAGLYKHLTGAPLRNAGFNGWLAGRLQAFVGGEPDTVPDRWAERSPLREASRITAPIVIAHGLSDDIVPPEHACRLRDALRRGGRRVIERRFDTEGREIPWAAPACGAAEPNPATSHGARAEAWFFEGQGHSFQKKVREVAEDRAADFLLRALR